MPLDPRAARFLGLLAASGATGLGGAGVAARREGLAALMKFAGAAPAVGGAAEALIPGPSGPLAVRIYTPLGATDPVLGGLVYFHGGGLCAGSPATHEPIACELANAARCRVVSVGYRLAPEHRFPAAVEDALAATLYICQNAGHYGIDPKRLGIAGDSAGGTLAAATCQEMARAGRTPLAVQVLLCPILDYSRSTASKREFGRGHLVDEATLADDLDQYLPPGADPADPRISPLCAATVEGLPPAIVHTAECDPLRDEGEAYFRRLEAAGCGMSYNCHAGMIHLFYGLQSVIPHARQAYAQLGRELRGVLA